MNAQARQWSIIVGLALGPAVGNGFARFSYGLLLPAMRSDLSWSYAEAGWLNTANAIGYLIGAVLALRFVATLGAGRLYRWGMLVTVIALCAAGTTRDLWLLALWRIMAGVGGAPVFIAGGAMAARSFEGNPARNALAIAIMLPALAPGVAGLVASAATFGLAVFIAPSAAAGFTRKNLPGPAWAPGIALYTTVFAAGQTIGPIGAGWIADIAHSLTVGMIAAGAILMAGSLCAAGQAALAKAPPQPR